VIGNQKQLERALYIRHISACSNDGTDMNTSM